MQKKNKYVRSEKTLQEVFRKKLQWVGRPVQAFYMTFHGSAVLSGPHAGTITDVDVYNGETIYEITLAKVTWRGDNHIVRAIKGDISMLDLGSDPWSHKNDPPFWLDIERE